jgi:hypothetical protein
MKKVLLLVCTLLSGIPAFAQSLTPAEREKGGTDLIVKLS